LLVASIDPNPRRCAPPRNTIKIVSRRLGYRLAKLLNIYYVYRTIKFRDETSAGLGLIAVPASWGVSPFNMRQIIADIKLRLINLMSFITFSIITEYKENRGQVPVKMK
jgi:hypothetical protein